jgi:CDP-diacylglycerol--glycerol-3-phosphate 3-phosphatidyltransferase
MTIYDLKPAFQGRLRPVAALLARRGWTANQLTAAGLVASAGGGATVALGVSDHRWLVLMPVFLFIRMALNALDGIVAKEYGQATPRGRVFNEVADVLGDAVAYLPLMFLLKGNAALVAIVVVLAIVTEVVAVLDPQRRHNEGPLGKSDRAAAFGLLALLLGVGVPVGSWISWALAALAALATLTIWNRVRSQL